MTEDICYLCLRVPAEEVLTMAHILWKNGKIARSIGLQAIELIAKIYKEHRFFFCGHPKKSILFGIFYYLGIINKVRITQSSISMQLSEAEGVTHSQRNMFQSLVKILHAYNMDTFWEKWGRGGGCRGEATP